MFSNRCVASTLRLFLPAAAILTLFVAFFAIPKHSERRRIEADSQQRSAEIEKLRIQRNAQNLELVRLQSNQRAVIEHDSTTTKPASAERSQQSLVQEFAELLSVFESFDVECTKVELEHVEADSKPTDLTHVVSLTGSFYNMLSAMETIEANFPFTLTTELSMERSEPSDPCGWKIALQLESRNL